MMAMIPRLGWTLLHFLWQGTALVMVYAVIRALTRRAQTRYAVACGTLLVMAFAPPLTFVSIGNSGGGQALWTIPAETGQRVLPGLVVLWGVGVLAFSIRLFGGWRFTARLRAAAEAASTEWQQALEAIATRMHVPARGARLLLSNLVDVPTVIGWLRPVILLPVAALTGLPSEQITALLAHELAHIRRHDYLVSVLQSLVEAVLFYHPAVWWISEQIRIERELCCDDLAVSATGDVLTYARALASLEARRPIPLRPALAANGGSLANRIRRLIEPAQVRANQLPAPGAAWAMTLLWLAGIGVATMNGAQTPPLRPPEANIEPLPLTLPSRSIPKVAEPELSFAKRARNTLLFDPLVTAQLAVPATPINPPMQKWLNEDVTYIITDREREAFKRLNTDEEREQFIEQFWLLRDPTPNTIENEFKQENYRRIAYANEHFSAAVPGWKTDRGRIYITFGPPDEIDSDPPAQIWTYKFIEGVGTNVRFEFDDLQGSGQYKLNVRELEWNMFTNPPYRVMSQPLAQLAPQPSKFKDLQDAIGKLTTYEVLPMMVRVDYIRLTSAAVMTNITVQFENRDLQFEPKDGVQKSTVNLLGRITTMSRRPVSSFETPIEIVVPSDAAQRISQQHSTYQQSVPLPPGRYRLNLVAKDMVGNRMNNYEVAIEVPADEGKLAASSLILADAMEKLPAKSVGATMYAIGDTRVRPRLNNSFRRGENMGIYLQVYDFVPDDKTGKPAGSVEYEIDKAGSADKVMDFSADFGAFSNASASQVTIEKMLPLRTFEPGNYKLKILVTDSKGRQSVQREGNFSISE